MFPVRSKVTITVTFSGLALEGGGGRQQLNSRSNISLMLSTRFGAIGGSLRARAGNSLGIGIGARAAIGTRQDKRQDNNSSAAANQPWNWGRRAAMVLLDVGGDLHLHHLVG